ncbi:MAG: AAA family ATPase [Lachnospiraceae bacterium]
MNLKIKAIKENIGKVIIGNEATTDCLLTALLCGGHCLLEDVPGTGKTVLAKALAASVDADFSRIQFTPDLLPSDITGIYYFNKKSEEFIFRPGPVFAGILLGDEINRATPRTQSALLECMAEKQITIEGHTHKLADTFFVIATENPIESSGTFPLPEAQLDRFMLKLSMEKPTRSQMLSILDRFNSDNPLEELKPVCRTEDVLSMQKEAGQVYVSDAMKKYILDITDATNNQPEIAVGASTRAALSLLHASKAYAYIKDRDFITPEDVKFLVPKVYAHRLVLSKGSKWQSSLAEEILIKILDRTPVPTENWK